jgi:hypothetical protein
MGKTICIEKLLSLKKKNSIEKLLALKNLIS